MPTDLPKAFTSRIISLAKAPNVPVRAIDNPKIMRDFRAVCERMKVLDTEADTIRHQHYIDGEEVAAVEDAVGVEVAAVEEALAEGALEATSAETMTVRVEVAERPVLSVTT